MRKAKQSLTTVTLAVNVALTCAASGQSTEGGSQPSPSICATLEAAATSNELPLEFFARIIWQESRFRADALGPVTRNGQHAQGIAQFMPLTAAERRLHDPFDPLQALHKSAELLHDLKTQFGNLGLAAAAYNAGPTRVHEWLAQKRTLPAQTRAYVKTVTGHSAEEWINAQPREWTATIPSEIPCPAFEYRLVVAQPAAPKSTAAPPESDVPQERNAEWGIQLVGDRSETKALAAYHQLQAQFRAILGGHEPLVLRTTIGRNAAAVWHRVRVGAASLQAAETLCSRLRAVGGSCLVQRN